MNNDFFCRHPKAIMVSVPRWKEVSYSKLQWLSRVEWILGWSILAWTKITLITAWPENLGVSLRILTAKYILIFFNRFWAISIECWTSRILCYEQVHSIIRWYIIIHHALVIESKYKSTLLSSVKETLKVESTKKEKLFQGN